MTVSGRKNADSRLLAALAAGKTVAESATEAGVSQSTVYRRLDDQEFRQELDKIKDNILSNTVAKLTDACSEAVETLRALLGCDSPSTRLGAARSILELSVSMRTAVDFADRISDLEKKNGKSK
jgi:hypothetical protein